MKFHVNENCIGCGLCASICSDVFQLNDGVAVAKSGPVDAGLEAPALEAQQSCPVSAIEQA